MEAIYIPQLLNSPNRQTKIAISHTINNFETLTPVRGTLIIRHGGNFLEVSGKAEAIVTLTCDRCLQNYNHRLALDTSELIWLEKESERTSKFLSEKEITMEDLVETLPSKGYFEPEIWLYEQLSLLIPMSKMCTGNCQSIIPQMSHDRKQIDNRWASLASLKQQLENNN